MLFSVILYAQEELRVGAECTEDYLSLIQNKNIAIVANQTSVVSGVHLVDTLLSLNISIKKIFAPEHGFRGKADAGEHVQNGIDKKTQLPLISLYGKHKKPTKSDLQGIDVVVFDIQDVGARFYTYISTMHYVMEACAENNVTFLVLDRPNPNGFYVDGPVLEKEFASFVGMHPVPIVHGMTIAEYAQMINGEKWLQNSQQCDLKYVLCDGYDHTYKYELPIAPSPNLASMQAIYLYPSLCWFEGTVFSCGRGTDTPFEIIGNPHYADTSFSFVPRSIFGASKNPRFKGERCYGIDLRKEKTLGGLRIDILLKAYKGYFGDKEFFTPFFTKLVGSHKIENALKNGMKMQEISALWVKDVEEFMKMRKKYLLYKDF